MNKKFAFFFLILFISSNLVQGQSPDTKLWTSLSVKKKLAKKVDAEIEFGQRLENNISTLDKFLLEPSLKLKLNKIWSFELLFRYWLKQEQRNDVNHQRFSLGLAFDKEIDGIELKLLTKLQYGVPDAGENLFNKLISRNSLKLSYPLFGTRFTPYLKYELFTDVEGLHFLNYQWRIQGGSAIYLSKTWDIKIFYLFENEYNIRNASDSNILGIAMKYSL